MGDRSLSNGFITFSDISSEAVLSLDDSSFHYLTVDQVEFGYQVSLWSLKVNHLTYWVIELKLLIHFV